MFIASITGVGILCKDRVSAALYLHVWREAGVLASNFFVYNKIIALGVLGLFTPSFEVPDFQSGSSVVFAATTFSKV